jgi:hypothetical protein
LRFRDFRRNVPRRPDQAQDAQALDALPAGELIRDRGVRSPRGRKVTVAMLLSAEAGDERKHGEQIRTFATQLQGSA